MVTHGNLAVLGLMAEVPAAYSANVGQRTETRTFQGPVSGLVLQRSIMDVVLKVTFIKLAS